MAALGCALVAGCSGGGAPVGVQTGGGAARAVVQPVQGPWVRYHSPLGWSISYPKGMDFKGVAPAFPDHPSPPGGPYTTVTMANFPWPAHGGKGTYGVPVDRSQRFPQDGLAIQIQGGAWAELLQVPDARFPLSFSDFRRGAWPVRRLPPGAPWPMEHTIDAAGQRYFVQVWLGRDAPASVRVALNRIVASIKFDPLRPGTLHGSVAVVQAPSHYPVGSFTLLHIKGETCSGSEETCHRGTEPIYLVHAPGRFRYEVTPPAGECAPASFCVPFGSFYAIGWKDKTGYPSGCHMRLDLQHRQFYCANNRARWDVGGRPIIVPDHGYPTALSFDLSKIGWDGHVIIGGKFTAEIPKRVIRGLWPALRAPVSAHRGSDLTTARPKGQLGGAPVIPPGLTGL